MIELSIVIPAYNEESRITTSLEKIVQWLSKKSYGYEILVVDDGSTDSTPQVVNDFIKKLPVVQLLSLGRNMGKGSAVKKGILASRGNTIFFTDADLSTPIEETDRFFEELKKVDIVIGSRSIDGANVVLREPILREVLGKLFNLFVQVFCVPGFIDTQCGAKMFRREAARSIFSLLKLERFAFDVEVIYLAKRLNFSVSELPITWYYSSNTRVRTFLDGPKMLLDLLRIKWLHKDLRGDKNPR